MAIADERRELEPWTMSLERAEALRRAGFFDEDDHLELIYGVLTPKPVKYRPHIWAADWLLQKLIRSLDEDWWVSAEGYQRFPALESRPEPDITVSGPGARGPDHTSNVALVIEVADSSARRDLGLKARLYARAGIREYWVLDVSRRRLVVHRGPQEDGTWTSRAESHGERVDALHVPFGLDVGALFAAMPPDLDDE